MEEFVNTGMGRSLDNLVQLHLIVDMEHSHFCSLTVGFISSDRAHSPQFSGN